MKVTYSVIAALGAALAFAGCSRPSAQGSPADSTDAGEEFHADYDIAMTVLSAADAISVGEPLDSVNYSFDGTLTDGQGKPIYTNLHGMPGKWKVDAINDSTVTIQNIDLGDLMADELENYINATLNVSEDNILEATHEKSPGGAYARVYGFRGGRIRYEVHNMEAPNGIQAPMMIITLTR